MEDHQPEEFKLPENLEATGYRVFAEALEDDPSVWFHGTNAKNLDPIIKYGFVIPRPIDSLDPKSIDLSDLSAENGLPSISFARTNSAALGYACETRTQDAPHGCVIAVRYDNPEKAGIEPRMQVFNDRTLNPAPTVIAFCWIPQAMRTSRMLGM